MPNKNQSESPVLPTWRRSVSHPFAPHKYSEANNTKSGNKARADFAEALKDVRQLKQSLRGRSEEVRAYFIEYIKEKELMMYQLRRVLMRLERAKIELEEDGDWVERWECGEA